MKCEKRPINEFKCLVWHMSIQSKNGNQNKKIFHNTDLSSSGTFQYKRKHARAHTRIRDCIRYRFSFLRNRINDKIIWIIVVHIINFISGPWNSLKAVKYCYNHIIAWCHTNLSELWFDWEALIKLKYIDIMRLFNTMINENTNLNNAVTTSSNNIRLG